MDTRNAEPQQGISTEFVQSDIGGSSHTLRLGVPSVACCGFGSVLTLALGADVVHEKFRNLAQRVPLLPSIDDEAAAASLRKGVPYAEDAQVAPETIEASASVLHYVAKMARSGEAGIMGCKQALLGRLPQLRSARYQERVRRWMGLSAAELRRHLSRVGCPATRSERTCAALTHSSMP